MDGLRKMSSRIDPPGRGSNDNNARRAIRRSRLAPVFAGVAGFVGALVVGAFMVQAGLFNAFLPKPAPPPEPPKAVKIVSGDASRITGFDKNKQPFELTAQSGIQDKDRLELVHLQGVTGQFHRADGGAIEIGSDMAQYDSKAKALDLKGAVTFVEPGRYRAHMQAANVNVDDHSLNSQTPVQVDTASGTVEADSMTVSAYGARIVFNGHVKARFATNTNYGEGQ